MSESTVVTDLLRGLLSAQRLGVLATSGAEGPYASLVAFTVSDDLHSLFFVTTRATRKFQFLTSDPHVAMLVDSRSDDDLDFHHAVAATAVGQACELTGELRGAALEGFLERHPHLAGFAAAPSSALVELRVRTYYVVRRFQNVTELHFA